MDQTLIEKLDICLQQAAEQSGDPLLARELSTLAGPIARLKDADFLKLALWLADHGELRLGAPQADTLRQLADVLTQPLPPDGPEQKAAVDKLLKLRAGINSPRVALFNQIANIEGGIKFLVDFRARLIDTMQQHRDHHALRLIDADLMALLRSWFNYGFLTLVPINWRQTPALQLEKLMAFETVHPMADWDDLRRRLEKDRLCYAFYHPNMPDEPLIFVEIALTKTIATSIDGIFDPGKRLEKIEDATTAIFYSINATQNGLAGISLGNSLIKTVVEKLKRDYPHLRRFSTLSPMPGFRDRYLQPLLRREPAAEQFQLMLDVLESFFDAGDRQTLCDHSGTQHLAEALDRILSDDQWTLDRTLRYAIKPGLLRAAHFYLACEKRGNSPLNPVANFHLKNGALLYNINFLSNTSPKGMAESFGTTVNYHYDLDRIEQNQAEARQGRCIVSPQLERMLQLGASA